MENRKTDLYWRGKNNTSYEAFCADEVLQDSMMFRLIQISENAKRLSDQFRDEHPEIPWTAVYGLRNRIVHKYGNVDLSIVFNTLKYDIPHLHKQLLNTNEKCFRNN